MASTNAYHVTEKAGGVGHPAAPHRDGLSLSIRPRFVREETPDAGSSANNGDGERAATRARRRRECRADDTNHGDVDGRGGGCHSGCTRSATRRDDERPTPRGGRRQTERRGARVAAQIRSARPAAEARRARRAQGTPWPLFVYDKLRLALPREIAETYDSYLVTGTIVSAKKLSREERYFRDEHAGNRLKF